MESEIIQTIWDAIKSPVGIIAQPTIGIMFFVQGVRIGWETAFSDRTVKLPMPRFILVLLPIVIGPLWLFIAPLALKAEPYHWAVALFGGIFLGVMNIFIYDKFGKKYLNKMLPSQRKKGTETPQV